MAKKVQLKERGTNVNIYPVTIKEAVGLGNVDNTSDANKPISTATLAALDELSKDIEILNILSLLEPSADITKDLIIEMNDGTIYSVPNIDWTVKGEGNPKAASVNFSNSNFADLWVQGSEYLPKFKRVISYGDLSSVDGRINIYQIPGKIPHMWPNNAPDYELLLPLELQEPPVIPEINVPREFGLSNLKLKPGYDLTFQCSGNIPFGIFYLTDFEGTQHDDSPRKYDHELTFTNVTTNSKLGEIFYEAKLDPRGIHITGLDGKVEKDGTMLLATRANWKWLPAKKDTKPAYWSFDLSKYTVSKKDFEFKGSYIGEDRFTKDNPMDMDWFGISLFSGHIFVGVENLKYIKASLPKATSVTYMSMSPFLEGLEITELGDANVANIVNACPNIRYIKINMSNVTNANNMFYAANGNSDYLYKNLTEVKLEGLKSSIDLSNLAALSLESVRYIFTNAVHILNKTITLYTDVYNKVPKAWLDEMAEKGWTVASSDGFSKFGKTANALKEDINYLDNKIENYTKVFKTKEDLETAIAANTLDCKLAFVEEPRLEGVYTDNKFYQTVPSGGKDKLVLTWQADGKAYWETLSNILPGVENLLAYGVEWKDNVADPHLTRIGNMSLHKTLPIQSQLKGCIALKDKVMYWLDENDWRFRKNPEIITVNLSNGATTFTVPSVVGLAVGQYLRYQGCIAKITAISTENTTITVEWETVGETDITNITRLEVGSRLDGYDGTVRVYCPEFYIKSQIIGDTRRVWLSTVKIDSSWTHQPEILIDAYRSTVLNTVPENMGYLSTLPVDSAISVVNTATYCRGGHNRTDYDKYLTGADNTTIDIFRTDLGKPRTIMSRATMRTCSRNAGSEMLSYDQYKNIFYWLYVVEYANFNCQEAYNEALTEEGYHQGGMGPGVTGINGSNLLFYNAGYPLTPCGYCNNLGNGTGIKAMTLATPIFPGGPPTQSHTFQVPRWRGFDNPFGDILTNLDGIIIDTDTYNYLNNTNYVYTCQDPSKYADSLNDGYKKVGEEIHEKGYTKLFDLGEAAHIIPNVMGGNTTLYKCDEHVVDNLGDALRTLDVGGFAELGALAGLGSFDSGHGVSGYSAAVGFRSVSRSVSFSLSK